MGSAPFDHLSREMTSFMRSSVLAALAELDFGTVILQNGNSLGAAELARLCACDERGAEALLDALAALGYFAKTGTGAAARYSVAEEYKSSLDSRHPSTFIPMMRHMAGLQRSWARLAWAVRDGKPQDKIPSILGAEQDRVSFIMAMNSIAVRLVDKAVASLGFCLSPARACGFWTSAAHRAPILKPFSKICRKAPPPSSTCLWPLRRPKTALQARALSRASV